MQIMKTEVSRLSIALGLALGAVQPVSAAMFYPETMFEAEAALKNSSSLWKILNDSNASDNSYLRVDPSQLKQNTVPAAGTAGELEWPLTIETAGNYAIWVRVLAPNTAADSFYWAIDDAAYQTSGPNNPSPNWMWHKIAAPNLSAGTHVLRLRYREAGMGIDRVQVTANPISVPADKGFDVLQPPEEHPRLFVTARDLPALRARRSEGKLAAVWANVVANAKDVRLSPVSNNTSNYDFKAVKAIHANALLYLFDNNENAGNLAVVLGMDILNRLQYETDTRKLGEVITATAIVYDWCYPLMNATQRSQFIEQMQTLARAMEISYPPFKQGAVVGHGSEAQLLRDQLAMAIATYDEKPVIYHTVAGRFFSDYVNPRNYAYAGGVQHQGESYGPYRYSWDLFASFIFKRMNSKDVFDASQRYTPYQWLYMRRPDGQMMRDGDSYNTTMKFGKYWLHPMAPMLAASYYGDSVLQAEFDKQWAENNGRPDDIWMMLFHNPSLLAGSDPLPLSRYFGAPGGWMIARTAWGGDISSNTVVATMKMGNTWFANHQHLDAGHFQLYYKGGLAIDSGIYEGANNVGYGSPHDINYHKRTIAHNAMLVHDPAESFTMMGKAVANDGGQRVIGNEPWGLPQIKNNGYEVSYVLKQHIEGGDSNPAPDYSYIKGDLKTAYSSKVSDYRRAMVFLNMKNQQVPAALLVFDTVTASNPAFKKTWLLHSQNMPQIDGNVSTITRTDNNYNGKLINTTLLPRGDQAILNRVGGVGNEFSVNGINYPNTPRYLAGSEEPGAWRLELSPRTANASDQFLNVMQVMDSGQNQSLPVNGVYGDVFVGAQVGDRTVLFAKNGMEVAATASLSLPQAGKVLITDLAAGNWLLQGNGVNLNLSVNAGAGTAYLTLPEAGTYNLIRQ